jgi:hypothetical protein
MYPRSWDVGSRAEVQDCDDALCRVWDALVGDTWDQVEREVNPLLDALIEAGYVEAWGHSDTGHFWAITNSGHDRLVALGRDA